MVRRFCGLICFNQSLQQLLIKWVRYLQLIKTSPTICVGQVILTLSMSTSSLTVNIHFNIELNTTLLVMIIAENTNFVNKIM